MDTCKTFAATKLLFISHFQFSFWYRRSVLWNYLRHKSTIIILPCLNLHLHPSLFRLTYLPAATKLGQGNVFTGLCDSVHRGGGCLPQCMLGYHPPWEQTHTPPWTRCPQEQTTPPWDQNPPGSRPPRSSPPGGRPPWEQTPPGSRHPPQEQTPPDQTTPPGSKPPPPPPEQTRGLEYRHITKSMEENINFTVSEVDYLWITG